MRKRYKLISVHAKPTSQNHTCKQLTSLLFVHTTDSRQKVLVGFMFKQNLKRHVGKITPKHNQTRRCVHRARSCVVQSDTQSQINTQHSSFEDNAVSTSQKKAETSSFEGWKLPQKRWKFWIIWKFTRSLLETSSFAWVKTQLIVNFFLSTIKK